LTAISRVSRIEEFLDQVLAECAKTGYVKTILDGGGDPRRSSNAGRQRNLAERTAINTVIQGSAADLIKLAMIAIHRRLANDDLPHGCYCKSTTS